ncbi:hypothetical protein [Rhodococcus triatomae]|uniref:hypothetical protein n=1 Tax=Rhodococcus triatomae TaxID=300028 RepID=UPI001473DEF9|nr:hypothetical protein [Rhodococcus triatomae]QNG20832.1 hypothetical protein G4H72_20775 [Rhodococcus triatomae]
MEVSIERLYGAGNGWNAVGTELSVARGKVESAKYSRLQFGLFQIPWDKYTGTAQYINDRLGEGVVVAGEIEGTLKKAADDYATEEGVFVDNLEKVDPENTDLKKMETEVPGP